MKLTNPIEHPHLSGLFLPYRRFGLRVVFGVMISKMLLFPLDAITFDQFMNEMFNGLDIPKTSEEILMACD